MLAGVPDEERARLLQAVALVYHPDRVERRRMAKATVKQRRAARVRETEQARVETGIRELRRKPVYHTPNVFPPESFEPRDVHDRRFEPMLRDCERVSISIATSASSTTPSSTTSTTNCVPTAPAFNFRKRTELADLRGRVALVTGGRVKIGYQAVLKLLRAGAHVIVTTRFPRDSAQRYAREADFGEWARPARDLRTRSAAHAERRSLLPRAAGDAHAARLHRQQRLPDGAPSA